MIAEQSQKAFESGVICESNSVRLMRGEFVKSNPPDSSLPLALRPRKALRPDSLLLVGGILDL